MMVLWWPFWILNYFKKPFCQFCEYWRPSWNPGDECSRGGESFLLWWPFIDYIWVSVSIDYILFMIFYFSLRIIMVKFIVYRRFYTLIIGNHMGMVYGFSVYYCTNRSFDLYSWYVGQPACRLALAEIISLCYFHRSAITSFH